MECNFTYDGRTIPCTINRRKKEAEINGIYVYGDDYDMMFGPDGEDIKGVTKKELRERFLPAVYDLWFAPDETPEE